MQETLATCVFLQGLLLCFGAAVGIKQLWWQLKWAMGVFRRGTASGEGRAVLELQPLRLKAPPLAGGVEALPDKRTGEAAAGLR